MTEMAAQRDPLLHFSAEKGRGEEGKAAVNTLLLRTGQGYPKMAQDEREGNRRAGNCAENHSGHETDIAVCGNRA